MRAVRLHRAHPHINFQASAAGARLFGQLSKRILCDLTGHKLFHLGAVICINSAVALTVRIEHAEFCKLHAELPFLIYENVIINSENLGFKNLSIAFVTQIIIIERR